MLFNSFQFLLFFPVVVVLYFLLPHKLRWLHLLISSCVFYAAFIPAYILILFLVIVIDFFAGKKIETSFGKKRKFFLVLSIIANVGVLFFFKYYNFFIENINGFAHLIGSEKTHFSLLNIILPIGLSFHTFQAMSYTIEVYRGHQKAERHFGIYALYVMFFPQLVAGPIERPQNMLHQFHEKKSFNYENATYGLKLIMWGMFKKVVIADRLAQLTDTVFNSPHQYSSVMLLISAIFFSFQIFCDFSGYSDIAMGTAKMMGFKLMTNFNMPYQSTTVSEFWKRWHISLSTWFKDYLYISLGGNRVSVPRWYFNLLFVFIVSGFWHGANWTFILWGALHGFYLIVGLMTEKVRYKICLKLGLVKFPFIYTIAQVITTYLLVMVAWIFFRARSVSDAFYIIKKLPDAFYRLGKILQLHRIPLGDLPVSTGTIKSSVFFIIILILIHIFQRKYDMFNKLKNSPIYVRWGIYYVFVLTIVFFGVFENRQFIYFQF